MNLYKGYEMVIGLEVHVELKTKTKIFCNCKTDFGAEPNTHVCPVCMGMPGTLPVLNEKVVDYAVKAGIATNCTIARHSKQDRKNYFYPDLPKAYQISQYDLPLCEHGYLDIESESGTKRVGITRIHIEEDAGKLVHDEKLGTLIDCNRCGVPLIEIVSEPDIRSAAEADAYLRKLRATIMYTGVSDCKMNEGSLRCDVNLSVRKPGEPFGIRTEMKNLNSFKAIAHAIEGERARQIELLEAGKEVVQETRRWDDNKESSYAMRSKEDAQDYRYFPEPDLVPVVISDEWIREVKARQPELRPEKLERYSREFDIPRYDAELITESKKVADLFEKTVELCGKPKKVSNWIMGEMFRLMKERGMEAEHLAFSPENLAKLIDLADTGTINSSVAKKVFEKIFTDNVDPEKYVEEQGLKTVNDEGALRAAVEKVLADNPQAVADYKGGKQKAFGALMGQSMRAMKGKADPASVTKMIKELLEKQ